MQDSANVVDSMKDLGKIVDAMKNASASLVAIVNVAINLDKKLADEKQVKKAAKNIEKIVSNVNLFVEQIFSAINTMTSAFPASSIDTLNKLFVDANEYQLDENGNILMKDGEKVLKESKTTLPVLICKFADSISKIFGSISKLGSGLDISPVGIVKAKIGFSILGKQLSDLLNIMTNTFSGLADDQKFKDMLSLLVSDPTLTSKMIETNKEAIQTGQFDSANTDKSHEWEETMTGKMGLLDAMSAMLNIFTTLSTLKAPNLLLFNIELVKIKFAVNSLVSTMGDIAVTGKEAIKATGDLVKPLEGFEQAVIMLDPIIGNIAKLGSMMLGVVFGTKTLVRFRNFLAIYVKTFTSKSFQLITGDAQIENITKGVTGIKNTMKQMAELSVIAPAALIGVLLAYMLTKPVSALFNGIAVIFSKENTKQFMESMDNAKDMIVKLSLSVLLLTTAIVLLVLTAELIQTSLKQIALVGLFILTVIGFAVILGLASKIIDDGVKNLLILSAAIAIISLTAILIVFVGNYITAEWEALLKVAAMVGVLVVMMVFIGAMSKFVQKGNIAILLLAVSIIVISAAIMLMIVVAKILDFVALLKVTAVIGVLAACVAGVGFAAIPIAIGSGVLMMMSVALILTSVALFMFLGVIERINKMNLTADEKGKQTVQAPIELFKAVIEKTNEIGLISIAKATAKMISLMIIAASLGKMADIIQKISSMRIPYEFDKDGNPTAFRVMTEADFESASASIAKILTTIMNAVGSDEMTAVLDNLKGKSVKNITKVMESAGSVEGLINAIEKVSKFDEKTITDGTLKIKQVITAYVGVLSDLFVGQGEWTIKATKFLGRTINLPFYQVISEALIKTDDLKKGISGMKTLNKSIEQMTPILDNLQAIVDKGSAIDDGIKNIEKIVNIQDSFAKIDNAKLTKSTNNFVRFVDKANNVDTKKIKTVTEMFEKMSQFSESIKGDFNALADVLSEKLVDVLNKLHLAITDLNGTNTNITQQPVQQVQQSQQPVQQVQQSQQPVQQNKKQIDPKALQNIEDILTEMSSILKDVRENTENIGGGF